MTPKPSQAGGLGGVAGVLATGSAPAAGLFSPEVCAQPPRIPSHEPFPLASLALVFVLVWLVAWAALCVFPPRAYAIGSAAADASVAVLFVPAVALLCFAMDGVWKWV